MSRGRGIGELKSFWSTVKYTSERDEWKAYRKGGWGTSGSG